MILGALINYVLSLAAWLVIFGGAVVVYMLG